MIRSLLLVAAIVVLLWSSPATPDERKPEAYVRYRQSLFTLIGWNFGAISAMVRGEAEMDTADVERRAARIAELGQMIDEGFVAASAGASDSAALPAIYDNVDDFQAKGRALVKASVELSKLAATGDEAAIGRQMRRVAAACKSCHDSYKAD